MSHLKMPTIDQLMKKAEKEYTSLTPLIIAHRQCATCKTPASITKKEDWLCPVCYKINFY